jgi:P27 family predicted phage terminase small subunit
MPARRVPLALVTPAERDARLAAQRSSPSLEPDEPPPAYLPRAGKAEWRRIVAAAQRADGRWLQRTDTAALAAYCAAFATFVAATQDVGRRGVVIPGRSSADAARGEDGIVRNPAVSIARDASVLMRQWAVQLGFTPDARGRANLGALGPDDIDDPDDPFD